MGPLNRDSDAATVDWPLLLGALGLAVSAFVLLLWLVWRYDVPDLACVAGPIPFSTRLAVGIANWMVRLLWLLVIAATPVVAIVGVVAGVALVKGNDRRRVARLVAGLGIIVSLMLIALSGIVAFAMVSTGHLTPDRDSSCYSGKDDAAQQGLAPDKALELKMASDAPIFINVRFAGEACCWADSGSKQRR